MELLCLGSLCTLSLKPMFYRVSMEFERERERDAALLTLQMLTLLSGSLAKMSDGKTPHALKPMTQHRELSTPKCFILTRAAQLFPQRRR